MNTTKRFLQCAIVLLCALTGVETRAQPGMDLISGRVSSQISAAISASVGSRLLKYELSISKTKGQIATAGYQPSNQIFLQHFDNDALIAWDFSTGAQAGEFQLPAGAIPVFFDSASSRILVLERGKLVRMSRSPDGTPVSVRFVPDSLTTAAASADGRWIIAGTADGEVMKIAMTGNITWRKKIFDKGIASVAIGKDGTRATVLTEGGTAAVLDDSGSTLRTFSGVGKLGSFSSIDKQYHLTLNHELKVSGADGTAQARALKLDGQPVQVVANAGGERLLVVSDRGQLILHTGDTAKVVDSDVKFAAFVGDRRYLSIRKNGVTYLHSIDVDHYLVAIVPSASGWAIIDHEGRYDGTVDGTNDITWKGESSGLSLDQFFDNYYQPGLLASYVNGEEKKDLAPLAGKPREGLFDAPKVELDFPDGKMKAGTEYKVVVVAESRGGDLQDDIHVFHNGKRLPPKSRIGSQKVQSEGRILVVQIFAFTPESGSNEVFAEARNSHGIAGKSEIRREVVDGTRAKGKLVLVGVGIDKYRDSEINLDFAVIDVKTFVNIVSSAMTSASQKVTSHMVMDEKATTKGIKSQLAELPTIDQNDTLIIMLAGHGNVVNGEWYFVPHDADALNLPQTAVSMRELQDALVASPVRRVFLMVDACYSGAGIDSFNRYRTFQRRFVQQLGRNAGVAVLTATRRDQQAAELAQLGHGLFTHLAIEGLAGSADTSPKDGKISAHELASFVGQNLEQRAKPFLDQYGLSQSPAFFVIGADFLISPVHQ
jgi:hypothetical protein